MIAALGFMLKLKLSLHVPHSVIGASWHPVTKTFDFGKSEDFSRQLAAASGAYATTSSMSLATSYYYMSISRRQVAFSN